MKSALRKPLSVLLSILMVLSVFGGMAFPAGAESKTIAEGVIYKHGDTIVLPGNGEYYVKGDYGARPVSGNGTVELESDEYSYMLVISGWGISANFFTWDYAEELNQGLSVLGITFTGSGTQSDPYMPKLAFGEVESTWAGDGEGTEDSPWLINDLNDLRTLSANMADGMAYAGKYLKLAADIDCGSDNWEAIGGTKMFGGTFDGDSHTITYRVSITGNESNKGLFYVVGAGGTVKNLNVAGSISSTSMYASDFGGVAVINEGTIINCCSAMDITTAGNYAGGIAGMNKEGATISYCAASGTITWTGGSEDYAYVAGITAQNRYGYVNNCAMLGDVLAQNSDGGNYAGRLIGSDLNASSSHDCYYLDTMTVTGVVNSDSVTAKTADELKAIGQAAYDAGYTVYGLALGAVASNPDQEAADAVIALIDAIGTVKYTEACKEKIDAARAAYDALTDAQKALVTNYDVLTTAEIDYAALQLVIEKERAYTSLIHYKNPDDYRAAQKTELANAIAAGKDAIDAAADTDAVATALANAKAVIDTIKTNAQLNAEERALEDTKATYKDMLAGYKNADDYRAAQKTELANAIAAGNIAIDAAENMDAALDALSEALATIDLIKTDEQLTAEEAAAFEAYKAEKKAAVEAMAEEGDSTDAQQIIADAAAAIDALTYDEAKTLDENKAAVDAAADIADRLAAQRATDLYAAKIEFDHYKTEQKAAVEAMAQEGDSEAVAQIIAEAAAAIEALIYDEFYTLAENKATVYTLANIADRLAAQRAADAAAAQLAADKAAFDAYKFNLVAAVQAMAQEGDSEAAAQIIADAAAAIALLDYDTAKTLDENKAAVDALADIAGALAAQRAADAAAAQLADAKADAKAALANYKNAADYRAAEQANLADAIAAGNAAIDAAADIDAVTAALADAKAVLDEIKTDAQLTAEELAAAKATFDAYKTDQKAAADALAEEGDSAECLALIEAAKASIDDVAYNEGADLAANEAVVDAILVKLADDLAAQREADKPPVPVKTKECPICGKVHNGHLFDVLLGEVHWWMNVVIQIVRSFG